jgi:23S rRNA pseudouridine2605 synthase
MPKQIDKRVTLDRLFSKLGLASRGVAQEWIRAGRVRVNRLLTRDSDMWVSWPKDVITIDDKPLQDTAKRFFLFHKPKGVITTHSDEKNRKTIFDLLPGDLGFIHAVGRLDQHTSGLLLLTNDTELSSHLTDPDNKLTRVYLVTVRGEFSEAQCRQGITGIMDKDELLQCYSITIQKASSRESHLEVVLTEGKNREIRRLFKALGHEVTRLRRIQYGPFKLKDLKPGEWLEIPIADAKQMIHLKI